jgi:alpha-L-rhamnosidase
MLRIVDTRCEYEPSPLSVAAARPRFGWKIASDSHDVTQAAYRLQVATDSAFSAQVWDSGEVASDESALVSYGGPGLLSRTRYYWRARIRDAAGEESGWSDAASFETAMAASGWRAFFVSAEGEGSWAESRGTLLRKEFELGGEIASARIYASALGLYELRLNGSEVGDEVLAPGWTSYGRRLLYQSYDVTALLRQGKNALCATVGAGWYKGDLAGWLGHRNVYGSRTALVAQLMVRYADGREETVASDGSWRSSEGPILRSEIYHGETYDARLEKAGWDRPGFDDSRWAQAAVLDEDLKRLVPRDGLPVRRHESFKPVSLIVTPKGEKVLDFGQNIAGRVRFRVSGKAGDRVALRHAEVLDSQGNFYTSNLRSAKARIDYVLKGGGEESYEPHFTYMGFRYVSVDAWPGALDPEDFEAIAIYSDMEETGSFESSSAMLNKLHSNILWGLKGNFVDIPSDCPQRDERLGWTGDAQVFIGTAAFLMGADAFYRKWLRDLAAEQHESGGVPFVVPDVLAGLKSPDGVSDIPNHSACGWGDAATICPWTLYERYADRELLEEQYPSMRAWVEYIRARARGGLIWDSGFHFGDWVALDSKEGSYFGATPNDFTATAFYAKSADLLAKAAAALGKAADGRDYGALRDRIVEAFRSEYFTPAGRIAVRTQTACVLALDFGLAPPRFRDRVRDTLLDLIKENGGHLVTGFLGTPYLCRALADAGSLDAAYALLMREEYPSWLYQVAKGATTVWEHWDGLKPDGSMWSPDMNSFNHYAYGSIGEWLHSTVAGLASDESGPGYKRIRFEPRPGGGLTRAKASLKTMYGLASIEWRIEGDRIEVELLVPHNAKASFLPPVAGAEKAELGSGSHRFSYPWPAEAL